MALVVADPDGGRGQLLVGRVVRTAGAVSVGGLHRVESALVGVEDVGWSDDTTLLVTAHRVGAPDASFTVGVNGDTLAGQGVVPGMRSVAACPGRAYLTGTSDDTLWADSGNGWRVFVLGEQAIYPG